MHNAFSKQKLPIILFKNNPTISTQGCYDIPKNEISVCIGVVASDYANTNLVFGYYFNSAMFLENF